MKGLKVTVFLLFYCFFNTIYLSAETVYVDASGPNDPGTGTYTDAYRRIQDAIDDANDGDVIEIRCGLYTGAGNYNLDPNGRAVTIRSKDPNNKDFVSSTIIDPNGAGRGFYFHSGEDANCIISGLTIRNGLAADDSGGAILCSGGSNPKIINCIIKDNTADWYGGAVFCNGSSPEIAGCIITGNSAHDGGAVECWSGNPELKRCIFSDNRSVGYGGALDCYNQANPKVVNCTFVKNSVQDGFGGAICAWTSNVEIKNCIVWANYALLGPQMAVLYGGNDSVSYCDIQAGQTDVYVDGGSTLTWGAGNFDNDPCFASFDPDGDPNVWDFHLHSEYGRWDDGFYRVDFDGDGIVNLVDFAAFAGLWMEDGNNLAEDLNRDGTIDWMDLQVFSEYFLTDGFAGQWVLDVSTSPCIDAGDPGFDWSAEPWPNGKRLNMGAYGCTSEASKYGNIADFDVSGLVNFHDYADFADKWGCQQKCIEDLNDDGDVNNSDLEIFIKNWLWQRQ